jgi:uncharacterized cupin superfamily protein
VFEAGPVAEWARWQFQHPVLPMAVPGKLFLQERLGLTGIELSLNALPPGGATPFLHRHRRNEELYVFLSGEGQFQVDGQCFAVREGTAVRVAPAGRRAWRNTGAQPLVVLVIQAPAGGIGGATTSDGERVAPPPVWP